MVRRGKSNLVTIKEKNQQAFKGKGKDVKRHDILKIMREAAKRRKDR